MPAYFYLYLDGKRRKRRGRIDAPSLEEAKERLRRQGLLITEVRSAPKLRRKSKLRRSALLTFTTQLHQLLSSGLPLFDSLTLIAEQYQNDPIYPTLSRLGKAIEEGKSLSDAMEGHPTSFPPLYIALVRSGEASGSLERVLSRLVTLLTRQQRLRKQLTTAMVYPAVIATFCLAVVFLLLTFAVPSIEALYSGHNLSPFTHGVLAVSRFLTHRWLLYLPILSVTILLLASYARSPRGKGAIRRLLHRLPLVKTLLLQNALARFTRALSTLQEGGVGLVDALSLSEGLLSHPTLEPLITHARAQIIAGSTLSRELKGSPLIPPMVSRMLAVGEESGQLPTLLEGIASHYEEEVEKTVTRLASLAQPAILIVMGAIVGVIMLAVLLPLTDVSQLL
ncbi:MAG: type II secretion system F family protein [Parachlamydiales bacterium]